MTMFDYNSINKQEIHKEIFLKKLTIVIFTFQRLDCVIKSISYWSNKPPKIIIVDGSPKSSLKIIKKKLIGVKNIYYKHMPNKSIADRIKFGASRSKTKYTMCQADDDFYLLNGLAHAIKKLEKKKDLIACMGQSIGLDFKQKNPYFFEYGNTLKNFSAIQRNPIVRLKKAFKGYIPAAFYAVFRTAYFKKIWHEINTVSCQELYEYEHAIRTYLEGSLSTINNNYWIRSFQYNPQKSNIDGDRSITFEKWYNNNQFFHEKKIFIKKISIYIQKKINWSKKKVDLFIIKLFNLLIKNKNSLAVKPNKIYIFILEIYLFIFNTKLRKIVNMLKNSKLGQVFLQYIKFYSRKEIKFLLLKDKILAKEMFFLCNFLKKFDSK